MNKASAPSRSTLAQSSVEGPTAAAGTGSRPFCDLSHPFENSKELLVVLPNDATDVSETRLDHELREAAQSVSPPGSSDYLSKFRLPRAMLLITVIDRLGR